MEQENPVDIQRGLPFLAAFIILFLLVLVPRLWFLQVVKGDYYYDLAENNRIRPIKIRPPRGIIYDRYGRPLVENVLAFDISIVPEDAQDINATINKTASLLRMSAGSIRSALDEAADTRSKYEPVKIREEAPWEAVAIVESHQDELPGVIVEPEHRRHYPFGGLGSHPTDFICKASPH